MRYLPLLAEGLIIRIGNYDRNDGNIRPHRWSRVLVAP